MNFFFFASFEKNLILKGIQIRLGKDYKSNEYYPIFKCVKMASCPLRLYTATQGTKRVLLKMSYVCFIFLFYKKCYGIKIFLKKNMLVYQNRLGVIFGCLEFVYIVIW